MLKQPFHPVGIVGYGAYVPRYRLPGSEISRVWTDGNSKSPVREKAYQFLLCLQNVHQANMTFKQGLHDFMQK